MADALEVKIEGFEDEGGVVRAEAIAAYLEHIPKLLNIALRRIANERGLTVPARLVWGLSDVSKGSFVGMFAPAGAVDFDLAISEQAGDVVARMIEDVIGGVDDIDDVISEAYSAIESLGKVSQKHAHRVEVNSVMRNVSIGKDEAKVMAEGPPTYPVIGQIVGTVQAVFVNEANRSFRVCQDFYGTKVPSEFSEEATLDRVVDLLKSQERVTFYGTILRDLNGRARKLKNIDGIDRFGPDLTYDDILALHASDSDLDMAVTGGLSSNEWVRSMRDG